MNETVEPKEPFAAMWCPSCKAPVRAASHATLAQLLRVRGTQLVARGWWREVARVRGRPLCGRCWHPLMHWPELPYTVRLELEARYERAARQRCAERSRPREPGEEG